MVWCCTLEENPSFSPPASSAPVQSQLGRAVIVEDLSLFPLIEWHPWTTRKGTTVSRGEGHQFPDLLRESLYVPIRSFSSIRKIRPSLEFASLR